MTKTVVRNAKAAIRKLAERFRGRQPAQLPGISVADYWTRHNVTMHKRFENAEQSMEYFHWRNAQYVNYIELMPVSGLDRLTVLDLGCGPGNDLVGIGQFSRPASLIGADVSASSLNEAKARLALHDISADLCLLNSTSPTLPFESGSIDYIHTSGVLHHVQDLESTLRECRRVLGSRGRMRVMVYNYTSVWLHLYVAYVKRIGERIYQELDIRDAFARTTDGPECPIARVYKPTEFVALAERNGFTCEFLGAAISSWELSLLPRRFEAVMAEPLEKEHRDFLLSLTFDSRGLPMFEGHYAGVDGCYLLMPKT